MQQKKKHQIKRAINSLLFIVGVGLAIGGSINSYLVGILFAFPIGISLYNYEKLTDK